MPINFSDEETGVFYFFLSFIFASSVKSVGKLTGFYREKGKTAAVLSFCITIVVYKE